MTDGQPCSKEGRRQAQEVGIVKLPKVVHAALSERLDSVFGNITNTNYDIHDTASIPEGIVH